MKAIFYLTLDIIYKNPRMSKIFSKKLLEFGLNHGVDWFISDIILYSLITNNIIKKKTTNRIGFDFVALIILK